MKVVLVNFANDLFEEKQKYQNETAFKLCNFDQIYSFSPKDIEEEFYEQHKLILSQERGNGYWLWKPYFIKKVLSTLDDGDLLFYCDSGAYFIDSINSLIKLQKEINQDIIPFYNPHLEKIWTKRDTFILMNCDEERYINTNQLLGGINLWKKSEFTLNFMDEWIIYASDVRCITDIENTLGYQNYEGFKEHRHDQSIFSLLCKRYGLKSFPDPTQFGNTDRKRLEDSNVKQFLHHTKADKIQKNLFKKIIKEIKRIFLKKI